MKKRSHVKHFNCLINSANCIHSHFAVRPQISKAFHILSFVNKVTALSLIKLLCHRINAIIHSVPA